MCVGCQEWIDKVVAERRGIVMQLPTEDRVAAHELPPTWRPLDLGAVARLLIRKVTTDLGKLTAFAVLRHVGNVGNVTDLEPEHYLAVIATCERLLSEAAQ